MKEITYTHAPPSSRTGVLGIAAAIVTLLGISTVVMRVLAPAPVPTDVVRENAEHKKRIAAADARIAGWEERCTTSQAGIVTLRRSDVRYVRALLHAPVPDESALREAPETE